MAVILGTCKEDPYPVLVAKGSEQLSEEVGACNNKSEAYYWGTSERHRARNG